MLSSADPSDKEVLEIIRAADPRFIVVNGLNMMTRFSDKNNPYISNPNDIHGVICGIEIAPYLPNPTKEIREDIVPHEIANIYLLGSGKPFNELERDEIERKLKKSIPPLNFP